MSTLTAVGTHTWIANANKGDRPKRLIVIFLRGAIDGLNVVVPYREPTYYQLRPKIAIPQPGQDGGVLDLNGFFGLHPALSGIMPLWKQENLAFVHACGSHDPTRSHFDAQDYMETGTPGVKRTDDGWMNRLLEVLSVKSPIQAVNVGKTTPRILSGEMPVASIPSGKPGRRLPVDSPRISTAFDKLYTGDDLISQTYRQGKMARQALMSDTNTEMKMANNGAPLPNGFPQDAQKLASLMVKDPRIELAFMEVGGWDTHVNQGASKGQLAHNLEKLGQGLATLAVGLGSVYLNTTIVVMSEFGRTVAENSNGGTDHGHGNVMWLLGGVQGGIYGEWPALDNQYEQRDLAVTTDFRDVVAEVLERHMKLSDRQLDRVLPGYVPSRKLGIVI